MPASRIGKRHPRSTRIWLPARWLRKWPRHYAKTKTPNKSLHMKIIPFALFLTLALTLTGCVTDNGKFPESTVNFMPKRTYAVQYDKLWQATLDALDKNQITVVSTDKSDGIIQTDYIAGPGTLIMLTAQSTRYKFNITLRNE